MSRWCCSNCYIIDELFWNLELMDLKQSVVHCITSRELLPSRPSEGCTESSTQASVSQGLCVCRLTQASAHFWPSRVTGAAVLFILLSVGIWKRVCSRGEEWFVRGVRARSPREPLLTVVVLLLLGVIPIKLGISQFFAKFFPFSFLK